MQSLDARQHVGLIDPELLFQQLQSGRRITLIDVRRTHELSGPIGRIPGARSLPLHQLGARFSEFACHRSEPIVVISTHGTRSRVAAIELGLLGFEEVMVLDGGLERWRELGFPIIVPAAGAFLH